MQLLGSSSVINASPLRPSDWLPLINKRLVGASVRLPYSLTSYRSKTKNEASIKLMFELCDHRDYVYLHRSFLVFNKNWIQTWVEWWRIDPIQVLKKMTALPKHRNLPFYQSRYYSEIRCSLVLVLWCNVEHQKQLVLCEHATNLCRKEGDVFTGLWNSWTLLYFYSQKGYD